MQKSSIIDAWHGPNYDSIPGRYCQVSFKGTGSVIIIKSDWSQGGTADMFEIICFCKDVLSDPTGSFLLDCDYHFWLDVNASVIRSCCRFLTGKWYQVKKPGTGFPRSIWTLFCQLLLPLGFAFLVSQIFFGLKSVTPSVHETVRQALKILQNLLQGFSPFKRPPHKMVKRTQTAFECVWPFCVIGP